MFGKYPGAYLHRIASYKFHKAKDWLNPRKVPQNLKNKIMFTFFKGAFKLANMPGRGLFLGELIPLRGVKTEDVKGF